jgi:hypothetical protein
MNKFQVVYKNQKKKVQKATFYSIDDAFLWENHVKKQGFTDVEVIPVFN